MKTKSAFNGYFTIPITLLLVLASSPEAMGQAGVNGGKPIVTFNPTDPAPVKSQSPPAFPGGEAKLKEFVFRCTRESQHPIKLGRKTWLTARLDQAGKVVSLLPTYDADPSLKREMERIGALMPRWNPGRINGKGVDTQFQFLLKK